MARDYDAVVRIEFHVHSISRHYVMRLISALKFIIQDASWGCAFNARVNQCTCALNAAQKEKEES